MLESSRRDLHNALLCTVLESFSNLKISAKNRQPFFAIEYLNFRFFIFCIAFCIFSANFWWIVICFPDFAPNSRKQWHLSFFNQIYENKLENCRKFRFLKFVKIIQYHSIIQYYSIVSLNGTIVDETPFGSRPNPARHDRGRDALRLPSQPFAGSSLGRQNNCCLLSKFSFRNV